MKKTISILISVLLCFQGFALAAFAVPSAAKTITDLNVVDPSTPAGNLETDGYHWDEATSTLQLKDMTITGTLFVPDSPKTAVDYSEPRPVTIVNMGNSSIHRLDFRCPKYPNGHYYHGGILFSGTGTLTIETQYLSSGLADSFEIKEGMQVYFKDGISTGTSGSKGALLRVDGTLHVTTSEYTDVVCGAMVIGAKGAVYVDGENGIKLCGLNDMNNAFVLHEGGIFRSTAKNYSLFVFCDRTEVTEQNLPQIIDIPAGFFPANSSYGFHILTEDNGGTQYGITLAKKTDKPIMEYESVHGAGSLTFGQKFTSGENSTWNRGMTEGLSFRLDADFAWLEGVTVDGVLLPDTSYEKKEGSIIITLTPAYLATLSEAEHSFSILYSGGEALTTFTVAHAHIYADAFSFDETNHWQECDCGDKKDVTAHTFEWVVDQEATTEAVGKKHEECSVCHYKKAAVEIPKLTVPTPSEPTKPVAPPQSNEVEIPKTSGNDHSLSLLLLGSASLLGAAYIWRKEQEL